MPLNVAISYYNYFSSMNSFFIWNYVFVWTRLYQTKDKDDRRHVQLEAT